LVHPLVLFCYISWTIAYVLIIRRGFAERAYGMPIAAAAANVAWELIFSFVRPYKPPELYGNIVWFALDLVIVFQCVYYGRREWAPRLSATAFQAGCALVLALAGALVWFVSIEFPNGPRYAAFGQNFMMSALFIALLFRRGDRRGQSVAIAGWKLLGTAAVSLYCVLTGRGSPLLNALFLGTLLLDAVYVALLAKAPTSAGDATRP
jgi:hypothetical protein